MAVFSTEDLEGGMKVKEEDMEAKGIGGRAETTTGERTRGQHQDYSSLRAPPWLGAYRLKNPVLF